MRDLETVDAELRLLAAVRWSIREHGGEPSSHLVDELLDDERNELTGKGRSRLMTLSRGTAAYVTEVSVTK